VYYLVESNGSVHGFGGAVFFGSLAKDHNLPGRIVASAAVPNGGGYWLVESNGIVYNFGTAAYCGSALHVRAKNPIVAMAPTPDGYGYWLADKKGSIFNFGDAQFYGSAVHFHAVNVVGFAPSVDGHGYWIATSRGAVYNFGDAPFFGSAVHMALHNTVVAITPTPDGMGYWLVTSTGNVFGYGDAHVFASTDLIDLNRPITSMASSPDGQGYWLADADGTVYSFGDAPSEGSLPHAVRAPLSVVAITRTVISTASPFVPLPHELFGYDISDYQCLKPGSTKIQKGLPTLSPETIIEAAGWLDSADNSCLAAEAAWAKNVEGSTGGPYNLYLFMNAPSEDAAANTMSATGPAGTCAQEGGASQLLCLAFNYGYNGAENALQYATSAGVTSDIWWLDVENASLSSDQYSHPSSGQYWSDSIAQNDRTIAGAYEALKASGLIVGIYSSSLQYPKIAGDFIPSSTPIPLWIAGVPWTNPPFSEPNLPGASVLSPWCSGSAKYSGTNSYDVFAGGIPWMLQETPGTESSPYGIDPDYTC
jgi:hypothetical protein